MKRLLLLMIMLICTSAYGQHRPLKHIEVNESNVVYQLHKKCENNITASVNTYSASSLLVRLQVSHELGIKYYDRLVNDWLVQLRLRDNELAKIKSLATFLNDFGIEPLTLKIGESSYTVKKWYLGNEYLIIDINKSIAEHISISGFQSINFNGQSFVAFEELEQEMWRRCAKDVYENRKHL